MKTTLEIPAAILRCVQTKAAAHNIPLCKFVSDALAEKLAMNLPGRIKARTALAGKLRHLHRETARINTLTEREFGRIDPDQR